MLSLTHHLKESVSDVTFVLGVSEVSEAICNGLNQGRMAVWMSEVVIAMNAGGSFEGNTTFTHKMEFFSIVPCAW